MCIDLCDIFSTEFIPLALKLVQEGYDRSVISLEEELLIYATITGNNFPELGEFAGEYLKREEEIKRNKQRIESGDFSAIKDNLNKGIETIRNAGMKIGRNDPCPCGSGKKYKKCCLN